MVWYTIPQADGDRFEPRLKTSELFGIKVRHVFNIYKNLFRDRKDHMETCTHLQSYLVM